MATARRREPTLAKSQESGAGESDTAHSAQEYTAAAMKTHLTRQSPHCNRRSRNRRRDCRRRGAAKQLRRRHAVAARRQGVRTLRLKFPAGSRSNWHSHASGQLLMIEEGKGRTQERNGPLLEMSPGVAVVHEGRASSTGTARRPIRTGAADDLRRRREVARAGHGRGLQGGAEKIAASFRIQGGRRRHLS